MLPLPVAKLRFNSINATTCEVHWLYTNGLDEGSIFSVYDHNSLIDQEIAIGQAVEFAEYVVSAAKGAMVEHAQHFLSNPFANEIRERLRRPVVLEREDRLAQIGDELKQSDDPLIKSFGEMCRAYADILHLKAMKGFPE